MCVWRTAVKSTDKPVTSIRGGTLWYWEQAPCVHAWALSCHTLTLPKVCIPSLIFCCSFIIFIYCLVFYVLKFT